MNEIKIDIRKAQITGFNVELKKDGMPSVNVNIALLTEAGAAITSYTISTDHWDDNKKFDMPMSIINPIMDILKDLETESIRHINKGQLALST